MPPVRAHGVGPVDLLYPGVLGLGLGLVGPTASAPIALGTALFALLVGLVDWAETRDLLSRESLSRREYAAVLGLTGPVLACLFAVAVQPAAALPLYFGLLAGLFFLQAVRDALALGLSPLELLSRGYPNLVAVFIVLSAAADAVNQYRGVLVLIAVLVYLARKWFRWGEQILAGAGIAHS